MAADDPEDLSARLELLEAENAALRAAATRARQTRYRRTAAGLVAIGVLATVAALLFPGARNVLFALGATGLFAGLLTYYLAPERFIAADVGEATYRAHADSAEAMVDALGLADERVYCPRDSETDPVRLYVPQHADYDVPDDDALEAVFVVTEHEASRGVSFYPTGVPLFRELQTELSGPLAEDPAGLADQLADGLVESFELAEAATPDVEPGRVTLAVRGSAYGDEDRIDHPVASLLGVGLAAGLDRPVTLETAPADDERSDVLVTGRWTVRDADA